MGDSRNSVSITPNDGADLTNLVNKIRVDGLAGDVVVTLAGDSTSLTFALAAGELLEGFLIKKVHATGTTATVLVGFYE